MNDNLKTIPDELAELELRLANIREKVKAQVEEDLERLKLYASTQGTARLDALGAIDKLCGLIESRIAHIKPQLERELELANKAARTIEIKPKEITAEYTKKTEEQ